MPPKQSTKAKPEAPPIDDKVTHLIVKSSVDGFRRAGRAWPAAETVVQVDEFTEAEITDLMTEPKLTVIASAGDPAAEKK